MVDESETINPDTWWKSRRLLYNAILVIAGVIAFLLFALAIERSDDPELEITVFTVLFQVVGYLIMMVAANLCYFIGPVSEKLIRPRHTLTYRKAAFWAGSVFSAALPICFSFFILLKVI